MNNEDLLREVIDFVLMEISEITKIQPRAITSKRRSAKVVACRDMVIYITKEYTQQHDKDIGFIIDKDRTTVFYSYNKMKDIVEYNDGSMYIGPFSSYEIRRIVNETIRKLKVTYGKDYNKASGSSEFNPYYWRADGPENKRVNGIGIMLANFSRKDAPQEED
jgi:hypothetical protein